MSLESYLSGQGYNGQFPGVGGPGRRSWYTDLYGDQRYAGFLEDQMRAGGYLSEASVNPFISQLVEGNVGAWRNQQQQQGGQLAAAGMNPAVAARYLGEQESGYKENIAAATAGFQGDLQKRRYDAGESFVEFQSALEGELTARAENARRYRKALRDADKDRTWNRAIGLGGLALGAYSAFSGPAAGAAAAAGASGAGYGQATLGSQPIGMGLQQQGAMGYGISPNFFQQQQMSALPWMNAQQQYSQYAPAYGGYQWNAPWK